MSFRLALFALVLGCVAVVSASCGDGGSTTGHPKIVVSDAVAGASGANDAAAYLVLRNTGPQDALVGVDVDGGASATVHRTTTSDGRAQMRHVESMEVPADGELRLDPGGSHIMIEGLEAPLDVGDRLRLTLHFERAPDQRVTVVAVPLESLPDRLGSARREESGARG